MALPGFGIVQVPALEEGLIEVAVKPTVPPNGWLRMRAASPREWLSPEEVPFSADLTQSYRAMSPDH